MYVDEMENRRIALDQAMRLVNDGQTDSDFVLAAAVEFLAFLNNGSINIACSLDSDVSSLDPDTTGFTEKTHRSARPFAAQAKERVHPRPLYALGQKDPINTSK